MASCDWQSNTLHRMLNSYRNRISRPLALIALTALAAFVGVGDAAAQQMVKVQLIWATADERSPGPNLSKPDKQLVQKLKKFAKWTNYWEENQVVRKNTPIVLKGSASEKVKLNGRTDVVLQMVTADEIQITLFGKKKKILTKKDKLTPGCIIIIAGETKDDRAWFIVVSAFP